MDLSFQEKKRICKSDIINRRKLSIAAVSYLFPNIEWEYIKGNESFLTTWDMAHLNVEKINIKNLKTK